MRKRPSLNEIDAVLRQELAPAFAGLERERRRVQAVIALGLLVGVPASAAAFLKNPELGKLVAGLSLAAFFFLFHRARKKFAGHFKEEVMTKVAARFFPSLSYRPGSFVSKDHYDDSQLFRRELDTYDGNDHFSGKLGDVDFQFSELLCQYTTGSGKNRRTHTAFRGFFFVGDFHREIYFRTLIQPDVAEGLLGVMGRGLQRLGNGDRLVDLEDPEFEKLFVVTSDDQVEARYILTPVFMEKLRDFRARVGCDLHLSFVNGKMRLAIETNHDYFEPNLWGEILSRRDLMKFIDMLILLIGVAEEFLHHRKFAGQAPAMPHPPLPKRVMPPLPMLKK